MQNITYMYTSVTKSADTLAHYMSKASAHIFFDGTAALYRVCSTGLRQTQGSLELSFIQIDFIICLKQVHTHLLIICLQISHIMIFCMQNITYMYTSVTKNAHTLAHYMSKASAHTLAHYISIECRHTWHVCLHVCLHAKWHVCLHVYRKCVCILQIYNEQVCVHLQSADTLGMPLGMCVCMSIECTHTRSFYV